MAVLYSKTVVLHLDNGGISSLLSGDKELNLLQYTLYIAVHNIFKNKKALKKKTISSRLLSLLKKLLSNSLH